MTDRLSGDKSVKVRCLADYRRLPEVSIDSRTSPLFHRLQSSSWIHRIPEGISARETFQAYRIYIQNTPTDTGGIISPDAGSAFQNKTIFVLTRSQLFLIKVLFYAKMRSVEFSIFPDKKYRRKSNPPAGSVLFLLHSSRNRSTLQVPGIDGLLLTST